MKKILSENIPFQNISQGSSTIAFVNRLVLFLEQNLPDFPKEKPLFKENSENALTEELYKYLTRKVRLQGLPFEFQTEKPQKMKKGHDKRVDIAVRINTLDIDMEVIYCLEAKKLPTDRRGGHREKEYVLGTKGGIERFKNEAHGKDDSGMLLARNGLVAFIIDGSLLHWYEQINSWILGAGWPDSEKLNLTKEEDNGVYNSTHLCVSGNSVTLTHFWVKIS